MDNKFREDNIPTKKSFERVIGLVKKLWSVRFVRFLFVGGINTFFGYAVFSVFILLHIHYAFASLISTIIGVLFNFFTTGRIVFRNNDPKLILKFFGVYGIIYLINLLFLKVFDTYQVNMLIAGAILIFPIAILSYFLNKALVFRVKNNKSNQ
jgi:putative flippase GtrA